jgi:hypothetical protein
MLATALKILVVLLNVLMLSPMSQIVGRGNVPYAANARFPASK